MACCRGTRTCAGNMLGIFLFLFSLLNLAVGVGLIVLGCLLQTPPSTAVPLICVILGSVVAFSALMGAVAGFSMRRGLLCCYAVWALLVTLAEAALVIVLFVDEQGIVDAIVDSCTDSGSSLCDSIDGDDADQVSSYVETGRWVLLGWVCVQGATILVAFAMRACFPHMRYRDFDAEDAESRARRTAVQMQPVGLWGRLLGRKSKFEADEEYRRTADDIRSRYKLPAGGGGDGSGLSTPSSSRAGGSGALSDGLGRAASSKAAKKGGAGSWGGSDSGPLPSERDWNIAPTAGGAAPMTTATVTGYPTVPLSSSAWGGGGAGDGDGGGAAAYPAVQPSAFSPTPRPGQDEPLNDAPDSAAQPDDWASGGSGRPAAWGGAW